MRKGPTKWMGPRSRVCEECISRISPALNSRLMRGLGLGLGLELGLGPGLGLGLGLGSGPELRLGLGPRLGPGLWPHLLWRAPLAA